MDMDQFADPAFVLKYNKCKFKVKKWEKDFRDKSGSDPSKDDIKEAPIQIREAYKWYWRLKIHALGQDSLKFAPFFNSLETAPLNDETAKDDSPKDGEILNSAQSSADSQDPQDHLHDDNMKPVKSNIWGSHLNNSTSKENKSTKLSLHRSSSFQLAEKLFNGSKFKKRNPRKSLSSSNLKTKSLSNMSFDEKSNQGINSSCLHDDSLDGFPVNALEEEVNVGSHSFPPNFVVVKNHISPAIQPIGAVQKLLEKNSLITKPKPERKLNQGWVERVSAASETFLDIIPIKSDEMTTLPKKEILPLHNCSSSYVADPSHCIDDEDIIYDSDTDSKGTDHKSRLALLPNVSEEHKDSLNLRNSEHSKCDTQNRKRKVNALEAALTVLSGIDSADNAMPLKQQKKSRVSKLGKEDLVEELFDSRDKCTSTSKSKKQKLTKAEALEKRVASGSVNDNFVRINIQKKVFVRGKKTFNFQRYKKQQWRKKKSEVASESKAAYVSRLDPSDSGAGGGLLKCFKCGDVGHFARACRKFQGDSLLPNDELLEEESPFPSLNEIEKMALEKVPGMVVKHESATHLPSMVVQDSEDIPVKNNQANFEELDVFKQPEDTCLTSFGTVEPLYPVNEDGTLIQTTQEVVDCLHMFGHANFRPGQEEAIMRVLSGLSTLLTLSTGSGKSLCYQIPAYLFAKHKNCITLVISPLVSLMDDQVTGLPRFVKAAAIHTGQTEQQRGQVVEMVKSGKLQILLVSPEAIVAGQRRSGFGSLLKELPDIAFACIDEVHCISQWSHNFRPSYLMLCKVLREKLRVRTILGLTATATQASIESIIEVLNIPDGRQGVIQDTPVPNNLLLTVSQDSNRDRAVVDLLSSEPFKSFESIIVYCTRREECERLSSLLRTCMKESQTIDSTGRKLSTIAEAYHAGLSSSRRKQVQNAFMVGKLRIVVATVAFGMGINKSNIRAVIHFNMPKSFESYVQEVGRAGRDGQVSHCHLFLDSRGKDLSELRRHIYADSLDRHTIRKLLQRVFVTCKCMEKLPELNKPAGESFMNSSMTSTGISSSPSLENLCKGHEVAFSIEKTVEALDLPEENILTLLCYLELHDQKLIRVLPSCYTQCKVQSYRGMKHIQNAARKCPPLAMAMAIHIMNDNEHEKRSTLEFPVVDIANSINWDSGIVKRELLNLEWTKVAGQARRSGMKVELFNLGFHVKAAGNLSPEQKDAALDFLYQRVVEQERTSLRKLQFVFDALSGESFPDIKSILNSSDVQKHSVNLKQKIQSYFQEDHHFTEDSVVKGTLADSEQIARDVRQLVGMYRDCSFTGRTVARIFHGIGSPNFPPQVWGRCRFWRSHLDSDFKLLYQLAMHVLLEMR